jgi:hypothetical protein
MNTCTVWISMIRSRGAAGSLVFLVMCSTAAAAETGPAVVRGEVVDASGGVLPGVTVVATAGDGRVLATVVTDAAGGYVFSALPPGPAHLMFELAGFDTAVVGLTVQPGVESRVVQRLGLASITESVVVYGKAPVVPPDRPRPLPLPRPAPPVVIPVPAHDRDSICGPAKPGPRPESFGTIGLLRYKSERGLYVKGDELVIDGGTLNGLEVGRNLVARRYYRVSDPVGASATGEHSSGLLQIVTAGERSSIAVVVYACDELKVGDFLAAFAPEPIRTPDPVGIPAFGSAARILFADAGQMLGMPRRLMVIDQGSDQGIGVGQRLTLFRRRDWDPARPDIVGDAIVVAVRSNSATIRVERATDVIWSGDWAAPQQRPVLAQRTR